MKVLAIGDPHFKTSNIKEVDMFLDRIKSLCIHETPDLIVILGDLLHEHERLHTTPLNKAYYFVAVQVPIFHHKTFLLPLLHCPEIS